MKKINKRNALFIGIGFLLLIYVGIFTYLNLAQYVQHVDSDIAAEALLAREIFENRTLTPDHWMSSTERRVLGMSALAAPIYGITGSMKLSMGIACSLMTVVFLAIMYLVFRKCKISHLGCVTALLALCALPINGLINEDQMVPFVTILFFLFAGYYVMHCVFLFAVIGFYIYLRDCNGSLWKLKKKDYIIWIMLLGFCGGLALSGMRCLQVVALPMAVLEIILLFQESKRFSKRLKTDRFTATAFTYSILGVAILGKLYPTSVSYTMFMGDSTEVISRLTHHIPAAILEVLGIAGNCKLFSFDAFMQLAIYAVIGLTGYGLWYLLRKNYGVTTEFKILLYILLTSFLLTVFIEAVTTVGGASYYYFVIWFIVIAVIGGLVTQFEKKSPAFMKVIVCCVAVFAILNIKYTYWDAVTTTDNLVEYEEVITYMESEDVKTGYAEFWDASRISLMTDGEITMGHSYDIADLKMYCWLTNLNWYVPNLPEDMKTAYIVKVEDREAFENQFEDMSHMKKGFENQRFIVYISNKNFVCIDW